ncbi:hypothetical protein [Dyadobacter crusticola]|uniref:hypothetical protein n=1 Tax=Dyadobacter crusticola TaxID=292407 RepID=UPI0012F87322|nr:hypothetical protein [Dyadobacter crusticola]
MITKLLLSFSILVTVPTSLLAQHDYPKIKRVLGRYISEKRFITTEQVSYWLENADPDAHRSFIAGQRVVKRGGIVAIVGGSVAAVGGAIGAVEGFGTLISLGAHEATLTGPIILLAGSAVAIPGFAIMIAGKSRKNRAVKHYNATISHPNESAYFYHNISPGRIAIGIRF